MKLLLIGCSGVLTTMVEVKKGSQALEDIPVFKKFRNVFDEDLLWLPLDWEIEFFFNLVPGTNHISKFTYRITLAS